MPLREPKHMASIFDAEGFLDLTPAGVDTVPGTSAAASSSTSSSSATHATTAPAPARGKAATMSKDAARRPHVARLLRMREATGALGWRAGPQFNGQLLPSQGPIVSLRASRSSVYSGQFTQSGASRCSTGNCG